MKMSPIKNLVTKVAQVDPAKLLDRSSFQYVDISAVDSTRKCLKELSTIPCADAPSRARQVIHTNDVVVSTVRPNLNAVAAIPSQYDQQIASSGFCVLRANETLLNHRYLFYFCQSRSFVAHLTNIATGASYPAVNDGQILDTEIPLPSLTEQERIAAKLDSISKCRSLVEESLRQNALLMDATYSEIVGDIDGNPYDWALLPVSEFVSKFETGKSIMASSSENESSCRILKVSAVTWGDYDPAESKPVPPEYMPPAHHYVKQGDLLFSRANTTELVGAVAYVFSTPANRLLPDKIWRFIWGGLPIEPLFVWQLFQQKSVRRELGRRATGTSGSMKNISQDRVLDMKLPIPPIETQIEFAKRAAEICRNRIILKESFRQNDLLFQTELENAFATAENRALEAVG